MPLVNEANLGSQTENFSNQGFKNAQATNQTPSQGLFQIPEKFLQLIP
jgi:hypothetical protein